MKNKRWKIIVLTLLLLLAAIGGFGLAHSLISPGKRSLAAQLERTEAERLGLAVAHEARRVDMENLVWERDTLRQEFMRIQDVAPDVEIRETIRWRTREVEVPVDRVLGFQFGKTAFSVREDCEDECEAAVLSAFDSLPPITFEVRGVEARMESEAGNLFAVGEVELWRTSPEPIEQVAVAPWRSDAVDYQREPLKVKLRRNSIMAGLTTAPGVMLQYSRDFGKRWRWFLGGSYDFDSLSVTCREFTSHPKNEDYALFSETERRSRLFGGIGLRF